MGSIDVSLHLNTEDAADNAEISIREVPSASSPEFHTLDFEPDDSYGGVSIFLALEPGKGKTLADIKEVIETFEAKLALREGLANSQV